MVTYLSQTQISSKGDLEQQQGWVGLLKFDSRLLNLNLSHDFLIQ